MNLKEMTRFCCSSLWLRKLRSFLTVSGVILGISSIIILVGLVQGLREDVLSELEVFGPRTILLSGFSTETGTIVGPASALAPLGGAITEKDYERLERTKGADVITRVIKHRVTIVFKDEAIDAEVFGIEGEKFLDIFSFDVAEGRFLEEEDRFVTVIGHDVSESFDEEVGVQSNIYISGRKFRVVGVIERTGSSIAPIDDVVLISFKDASSLFNESMGEEEITGIFFRADEGADVNEVADNVEAIMLASHRVTEDDKDFSVLTTDFVLEQYGGILDLITVFLGSIASISLVVGGIGISNNMFMSVMERRREIGTLKAVGASQSQIRNIFLIESSIIGLMGGLLGLALAAAVALGLIYLGGMTFVFDPFLITGALLFSIVVGVVSGTLPAMEAAKLSPMMALRYE
jgi:putative ABC transport system permease protein